MRHSYLPPSIFIYGSSISENFFYFQEAQSFYPTETENLIVTADDTLAAR
jgi:hypothetical protein